MTRRQIMITFGGVMLGMLLAALDQTIVVTALPRIVTDLGGLERLSWVITAYMLTSTVSVPLYGKLSDLYGRRGLFLGAIVFFLIASALSGLSQNMTQLIVFRGLQGIGGGGIMAIAQTIIGDLFSPRERGRYQGYSGAMFAAASIAGPLAGGALTDHASWRWIFYLNLPLGAIALIVIATTLRLPFERRQHAVDYLGAALMTAGATCLLLILVWGGTTYAWGSATIVALTVAVAVLIAAFLAVELRSPEPVMPLPLFRTGVFAVGTSAAFLIGFTMFGVITYIPLFVQGVIGSSATNSGAVLIPLLLAVVVSSASTGQLISRTGRYKVFPVVGSVVTLLGLWLLTRLHAGSTASSASLAMVVLGVGIGPMFHTYVLAIQNGVPRTQLGVATASTQFFRSIGGLVGVATLGAVMTHRLGSELASRLGEAAGRIDPQRLLQADQVLRLPEHLRGGVRLSLASAIHTVFEVALPVMGAALVISFLLKEVPLRTVAHVQTGAELSAELGQMSPDGADGLIAAAEPPRSRKARGLDKTDRSPPG